jgi:predicted negative regulator of RcsB-dependent stress response
MIIYATIVIIVVLIFQQRIYERHTKKFDKKTRNRYDKVLDELRKEKASEKENKIDNS